MIIRIAKTFCIVSVFYAMLNLTFSHDYAVFLTPIVTVIHGWVFNSRIVWERPCCVVLVIKIRCRKIYPLQTHYCPLDHLACRRIVGKQEEWRLRGQENRVILVSVRFATKIDQRVSLINKLKIRMCPSSFVSVI